MKYGNTVMKRPIMYYAPYLSLPSNLPLGSLFVRRKLEITAAALALKEEWPDG